MKVGISRLKVGLPRVANTNVTGAAKMSKLDARDGKAREIV